MTREEAIKELQESLDTLREYDIAHSSRLKQALEIAISALEQTDIEQKAQEYEKAFMDGFESCSDLFTRNKEQQPCEDAISRVEALKIATTEYELKKIRELPSVNPIPCSDAISRDAVLSIIDGWYEQNRETENIEDLIILITYMDSVTPKSRECEDGKRGMNETDN